MAKTCNNTSAGQIIRDGESVLVIERRNYPEAYALPAGHVDEGEPFSKAALRETREEVGFSVEGNKLVFREDIDNPCKREGGTHHRWGVYDASSFTGEFKAGSDAKKCRWVTRQELARMAERTEYFMRKYDIPYTEVGKLTRAIFGADPSQKRTDSEWKEQMGLEPVWYYMLKKIGGFF